MEIGIHTFGELAPDPVTGRTDHERRVGEKASGAGGDDAAGGGVAVPGEAGTAEASDVD
jgi:hypothetical protein